MPMSHHPSPSGRGWYWTHVQHTGTVDNCGTGGGSSSSSRNNNTTTVKRIYRSAIDSRPMTMNAFSRDSTISVSTTSSSAGDESAIDSHRSPLLLHHRCRVPQNHSHGSLLRLSSEVSNSPLLKHAPNKHHEQQLDKLPRRLEGLVPSQVMHPLVTDAASATKPDDSDDFLDALFFGPLLPLCKSNLTQQQQDRQQPAMTPAPNLPSPNPVATRRRSKHASLGMQGMFPFRRSSTRPVTQRSTSRMVHPKASHDDEDMDEVMRDHFRKVYDRRTWDMYLRITTARHERKMLKEIQKLQEHTVQQPQLEETKVEEQLLLPATGKYCETPPSSKTDYLAAQSKDTVSTTELSFPDRSANSNQSLRMMENDAPLAIENVNSSPDRNWTFPLSPNERIDDDLIFGDIDDQ
jgi:hypothetical protein